MRGLGKIFARSSRLLSQSLLVVVLLATTKCWAQEKHDPVRWMTLWAGALPIIVAAPHGGREAMPGIPARRGHGVAQFATERDHQTAELAEQVALSLNGHLGARPFLVVARFERKYVDANRAPANAYETPSAKVHYDAYHRALAEACDRVRSGWGRGLLVDLHGQGAELETIFRGTDNGKSVTDLKRRFGREALTGERSIVGQLALKGYKVVPDVSGNDPERRYTGGFTTQTYGSHRGTAIDAIQLELGTNLRRRANLPRTVADLAEAIAVFASQYLPPAKRSAGDPYGGQP